MARRPTSEAGEEQLELFEANLRDGVSAKVDLASLEHPLFSISRQPLKTVRVYAVGRDCEITIVPSAAGAPTIEDKDILVYCASQLRAALNSGLRVSPVVHVNGYDLLRVIGRDVGGRDYKRLRGALRRLRGTSIETRLMTGGVRQESGFGLIEAWQLIEQPTAHAPRLKIKLSDWLFRAIVAGELLTVDPVYFEMRGLQKRLYEILRKHLGGQTSWKISLEKLREKCGSQSPPRRFKFEIRRILDRAEKNRVENSADAFSGWLLMLNGELLCGYANSDCGRITRAEDARKYLRSSRPVTAPATTAIAEASA